MCLYTSLVLSFSVLSSLVAFAGQWQRDNVGWWYQFDDGSYPTNIWLKIMEQSNDLYGDNDTFYYFNKDGYMLENSSTPDGSCVDENGREIDSYLNSHYFFVTAEKVYYKRTGNSADVAFGVGGTNGMSYKYKGDMVPDTETFNLKCVLDPSIFRYNCEFTFSVDGRYSTVNRFVWDYSQYKDITETWTGVYRREGNILTLTPDDEKRPKDIFYIEDGFLWTQEMYGM